MLTTSGINLDLLTAIPGGPIFCLSEPVVGILDEVALLENLVAEDDTAYSIDEFRLVQNLC